MTTFKKPQPEPVFLTQREQIQLGMAINLVHAEFLNKQSIPYPDGDFEARVLLMWDMIRSAEMAATHKKNNN